MDFFMHEQSNLLKQCPLSFITHSFSPIANLHRKCLTQSITKQYLREVLSSGEKGIASKWNDPRQTGEQTVEINDVRMDCFPLLTGFSGFPLLAAACQE